MESVIFRPQMQFIFAAIKRHVPAAWLPRIGGKNLVTSFDYFVPCSNYVERDTMFRKICLKHDKKVP